MSDCPGFESLIQEKTFWDFVIDFSGFRGTQVEQSVGALKGISRLYVYISSDSVYEVCEKSHKGPTEERDSTRPESVEERERLNLLDNYGHEKLQGEEALYKQRWAGGMPFMALRLFDVIGPREPFLDVSITSQDSQCHEDSHTRAWIPTVLSVKFCVFGAPYFVCGEHGTVGVRPSR